MVNKTRAIFAWDQDGESKAKEVAAYYIQSNMNVHIYGATNHDELTDIATKYEASHVLYFKDDINLTLVLLLNQEEPGFFMDITVNELVHAPA